MRQWNHEQPCNNACQSFDNFYRYPLPPFNGQLMSAPRGLTTTSRPQQTVWSHAPIQPPAIGRPPAFPPFPPHIPPPPPPPYQQLPNRTCMTLPFNGISGPFNRPPPDIGRHSAVQNIQGFVSNWPFPNYPPPSLPCTNIPPPNCPPPVHPLPNCPPPATFNVDQYAVVPRPVSTFHQRLPGRWPFCDQGKSFPMKRQLNMEHNMGKVHVVVTLLLHL